MKRHYFLGVAVVGLLLTLSGCKTVDTNFTPNTPTEVYFQRAQQASDQYDYQTSLKIYTELLAKKDLDMSTRVSAMYEVAFLHFKMGDRALAKTQFQKILNMYNDPTLSNLPIWVQILSTKIIKEIDSGQKTNRQG